MDNISLDKLGLTTRTQNALMKVGINFWDNLIKLSENDISQIKNIGVKSTKEVLDFQKKFRTQSRMIIENPLIEENKQIILPSC